MRYALTTVVTAALLVGCGEQDSGDNAPPTPPTPPTATAQADTPTWLLTDSPAEPTAVGDIKLTAKEGDTVVVHGRIGGRLDPMMGEYASFIMADIKLQHCGQTKDDLCKTPWDYCCEPLDSLKANTASVQIVGEANEVLELDLKQHGFEEFDEVIVVGTVGPRPAPEVFLIQATQIHRLRGG